MKSEHDLKRAEVVDFEHSRVENRKRAGSGFGESPVIYLSRPDSGNAADGASKYDLLSDDQLYRKARELDIPRRSLLDRNELIEAIRVAERG